MELAKSYLADGKGFNSRTSRPEPLKSACFDTKSDTKLGRGLIVADQALFFHVVGSKTVSVQSSFQSSTV